MTIWTSRAGSYYLHPLVATAAGISKILMVPYCLKTLLFFLRLNVGVLNVGVEENCFLFLLFTIHVAVEIVIIVLLFVADVGVDLLVVVVVGVDSLKAR